MDELKQTIASNISSLRVASRFTQAELAEKLNYSDKAISKWERGESIPDVSVLMRVAALFGVNVDYLLSDHNDRPISAHVSQGKRPLDPRIAKNISLLSVVCVWFVALIAFTVLWATGSTQWLVFAAAVPVSLIVMVVFNSIWGTPRGNFYYVTGLVWSLFILLYLLLIDYHLWLILLFGIPAQIIICLSFRFVKLLHPEEPFEGDEIDEACIK